MGPIHRYAEGPAHNSDNTKHIHFFIQRAMLQPTAKIHTEHSETNGPERLAWSESHTENSRRRLRKRMRQMKPAEEGTGALYRGRAIRPTERTFKNKRSGAIAVAGVAHRKSRSRATSPTPGGNLNHALCWTTSSTFVGSKQPRTYGRKQRLQYATASAKKYMS